MPDAAEAIAQGNQALGQLDFEAAFAHFSAAMEADPENAYAHYGKAEAALALDRLEPGEIVALYQRAKELDPENPQFLDGYATFCLDIGRFKEAEEAFNQAAQVDEENAPFYFVEFAINYLRKAPVIMAQYMDETTRRLISKKALDYVLKALEMEPDQVMDFLRDGG